MCCLGYALGVSFVTVRGRFEQERNQARVETRNVSPGYIMAVEVLVTKLSLFLSLSNVEKHLLCVTSLKRVLLFVLLSTFVLHHDFSLSTYLSPFFCRSSGEPEANLRT